MDKGMSSASFDKIASRRRSVAGVVAGILFMLSCPVAVAGFEAPEPPPELGENLTGYRTKQQILEQAIRAEESRNPPKMKIYRKDGTTDEYTDYNAVYGSSSGVTRSSDAGAVYEEPKQVSSSQVSVPAGGKRCCSKVIRDRFVYDAGKMFRIYDNSVLVFRIRDGAGVPWPISKAECSNNGFRVQLNKSHDSIRVIPSSVRINMANVKVYLQGRENSPLSFVVSMGSESRSDMYEWEVLLSHKSPLNSSDEFHGVTNITKSAKSRTTRRDVENSAVAAVTVENDEQAGLDGNNESAAVKNTADSAGGQNADGKAGDGENINPDAGIAAYPINQKILYAVTVSEDELHEVADRLYEAVE